MLRIFALTGMLFLSLSTYADVNDAGAKVDWGYTGNKGPANWASLNPSFTLCAEGKSQSPIDVIKTFATADHALVLNYQTAPMMIVDDGETSLEIGNTQTIIDDGHGVQLNFPSNQIKEIITYKDKPYQLVQFHIHLPSENTLHHDGFPMEIHFVHQGANGEAAVIGVFVKHGEANPTIQKIINNLPKEKHKVFNVQGETINPSSLMPAKLDYYSFMGSLTTPPCSEGVQWIVMADTITASPEQTKALLKAANGNNARPVQPVNGRQIVFSPKT